MAKLKNNKGGRRATFPVRLQKAAEQWAEHTRPMREVRFKMLQHYAGGWYSNEPMSNVQPLNLIDRGVQIIAPYLVGGLPKVLVDAKRGLDANRPFARTTELALEHLFREMQIDAYTLRPAVVNSLFSMGFTKTGIMKSEEVEMYGYRHDVGQPYCDNIDFEDYVGDVGARHREEAELEGHDYLIEVSYAKDSGLFKNYDKLKPDVEMYGEDTRPERITKYRDGKNVEYSKLHNYVRLTDLWLPKEGVIVTIPKRGQGMKILRTVEWDGPESGPFDSLAYKYFPNSIIPIPPVFAWLGYNKIINRLITTMRAQAERGKKILAYDLGSADDAKLIANSPDGQTVGVRNIDGIKEIEFGGMVDTNMPFVQYMEQQYSIAGGNLYTIGGRESQAKTLGQEQMLQANASKQLEDMVSQVSAFTKSITEKLAWFLWTDPLIQIPVIKRVAGLELEVLFSEEAQEGDFYDYVFDVEPYSMTKMNPEMRYQRLMQLISQVIMPLVPIAQQQGSMLNVNEVVKEAARFLDVRNMDMWWSPGIPQEGNMGPYQPQQGTTRPKSGQADGRFASSDNDGSNMNNLNQQQARAGGQSTADY